MPAHTAQLDRTTKRMEKRVTRASGGPGKRRAGRPPLGGNKARKQTPEI